MHTEANLLPKMEVELYTEVSVLLKHDKDYLHTYLITTHLTAVQYNAKLKISKLKMKHEKWRA